MSPTCSGIILSGGLSSRMQGINKAFLQIGGIRVLDRVIDTLKALFDKILLVTKDPSLYTKWDVKIVRDILEARSPLSGIHAGLVNMETNYAFCMGCDVPFLKKEVIQILMNAIQPGMDVIVPFSGTYYQPLCAVYSKRCVPVIEAQLKGGDLKVDNLFDKVNVRTIPYERFKRVDDELISFFNVNSPADLQYAEQFLIEPKKRISNVEY